MSTNPTPDIEPWIDLRNIRSRDSRCTRKSESRNTSINLAYKDRHALLEQVTQHRFELSRLRSENEALQSKLSDQQQVNRDLANTVLNQKKELRELVKQNEALRAKLEEANHALELIHGIPPECQACGEMQLFMAKAIARDTFIFSGATDQLAGTPATKGNE